MTSSKCKVEVPNQLPESNISRVQFKGWKEAICIYLKQNEDFLPFFPGGNYESWKSADEDRNRITELSNADIQNDQKKNEVLLTKRRKDLETMLNIIGRKVDQYDFDEVVNSSTSLPSIWTTLESTYDISRKGVHFLELSNIKYEVGESPIKFYKKIYHHFMDNLYKNGDIVAYKNVTLTEDEKLSPTLLNFILFYVIDKIDSRLLMEIKEKWGHLLTKDKCLQDYKDTILKAIPDLLNKLENKEAELSAFGTRNQRNQTQAYQRKGDNQKRGQNSNAKRGNGKFCRLCQTSGCSRRVYTSHNLSECTRWSRKDVEDLRVMILDMNMDPSEYPDSDPETVA